MAQKREELWLSKEETCKELGLSERSVEAAAAAGKLEKRTIAAGNGNRYPVPMYSQASVMTYKINRGGSARSFIALQRGGQAAKELMDSVMPKEPLQIEAPKAERRVKKRIEPWQYMTVAEAARYIRMTRRFVLDAIDSGRLPFERTARGVYRIKAADLHAMPASQRAVNP